MWRGKWVLVLIQCRDKCLGIAGAQANDALLLDDALGLAQCS